MAPERIEAPPTLSLTEAGHEFGVSRDTLKRRLNAVGAKPNADGRWRARDIVLAVDPDSIPAELRGRMEADRCLERIRAPLAELILALERAKLSKPAREALDALRELSVRTP